MQGGLLSLHLGGVAMGNVNPILNLWTALRLLGSLTELSSWRDPKTISFLLFPDGHSRLEKLGRRIRDGMVEEFNGY